LTVQAMRKDPLCLGLLETLPVLCVLKDIYE